MLVAPVLLFNIDISDSENVVLSAVNGIVYESDWFDEVETMQSSSWKSVKRVWSGLGLDRGTAASWAGGRFSSIAVFYLDIRARGM